MRHESTITISYSHEFFTFSGEVRSATRCERRRDVVLKRVREGRDPIVGRDVTNRRGRWSVRVPGADGRFYAKVLKRTFVDNETRVICQADRSRTVRA